MIKKKFFKFMTSSGSKVIPPKTNFPLEYLVILFNNVSKYCLPGIPCIYIYMRVLHGQNLTVDFVNDLDLRYQRGSRSLAETLSTSAPTDQVPHAGPDDDDDDDYDIPDQVEDVIGSISIIHWIPN